MLIYIGTTIDTDSSICLTGKTRRWRNRLDSSPALCSLRPTIHGVHSNGIFPIVSVKPSPPYTPVQWHNRTYEKRANPMGFQYEPISARFWSSQENYIGNSHWKLLFFWIKIAKTSNSLSQIPHCSLQTYIFTLPPIGTICKYHVILLTVRWTTVSTYVRLVLTGTTRSQNHT